jgi:hypothetical protein
MKPGRKKTGPALVVVEAVKEGVAVDVAGGDLESSF